MTRKAQLMWTILLILIAGGALIWTGMNTRIVSAEESASAANNGETTTLQAETNPATEEAVPQEEWQTLRGTVVSQEDNHLIIHTNSDEEMEIGLGPKGYWLAHGIALSPGDKVEIRGFVSDDEFEPAEIHNLTTGEHIVLRDEEGSPVWRGSEH